ncbi:vitronectin [Hyperolius riggenbachi]|uniref:vitronectin n=1 Tax=Hyperolius riggenbachi TaxID=752182 RepID=UPI0035A36729
MRALLLPALLLLGVIHTALTAEDSCAGRCLEGFNADKKCQCDDLCTYYQSCCADYKSVCNVKETRGDVFNVPEDEYDTTDGDTTPGDLLEETTVATEPPAKETPTEAPTEETLCTESVTEAVPEELCSGEPFDAFTNLKNGSIYAFRGKYFYELDDNQALEGYPKLIKDVWGIEGPIDAAFTRMNCQGKTYIFKGSQYWRFSDGTMDPDYPRDIDIGFQNIPNDIDAAFALPANNYQGKEKAYFFKGKQYWQYEFTHQPTREECDGSAPSELFKRYAVMQEDSWEDIFNLLFGGWDKDDGPRSIFRDWRGVPNGVDAVLPSRIYTPQQTKPSVRRSMRRKSSRRKNRKRRPIYSQPIHDTFYLVDLFSYDDDDEVSDPDWLPPPESPPKCQPVQSVYFFKNDKYYRVNLQTKRVDFTYPRYPRSIAEYWLGCKKSTKEKKSRS